MKIEKIITKKRLRIAGLMSGTSADGVDVAIIDFDGKRAKTLAFGMFPYSKKLQKQVFDLCNPEHSRVDDICHMNFALGEVFADSLIKLSQKSGIELSTIDLIGSHGQTIYHIPDGKLFRGRKIRSTLQIGEPSIVARRTGITVVADFRPGDIAAGGQGAPLVPYADAILFSDKKKNRALQNIGGIANVTYLPAGVSDLNNVIAFDTGPGNMIIDRIAYLVTSGKKSFDAGGKMAAKGTANFKMLASLMADPYFKRKPPKTTGREYFGVQFTDKLFAKASKAKIPSADLLATVTAFTAESIAHAYRCYCSGSVDEMIICGGGAGNATLIKMLSQKMPETSVRLMSDFGIDPDAKEAISFAILAYACIKGQPNNVPSATGATGPAILGKIIL